MSDKALKPKKVWWKHVVYFHDWTIFEKCLLAANFFIAWTFLILAISDPTNFSGFNEKQIEWNAFKGSAGIRIFLDILSFVTSMVNISCLILVSRRRISNFIWGVCAVFLLAFLSFINGNIGTTIVNLVIQAPMNIVGLVLWRKTSQNKVTIKPRELNLWYKLLVVFVAAGLTAGFYFVFSNDDVRSFIYQNDDSTKGTVDFILDSMILAVTMCAITLLTLKYSDQWYLWIFLDIIYCTMYVIQGHAELTVTWACGLINACYGLYMWKFRSKKTN